MFAFREICHIIVVVVLILREKIIETDWGEEFGTQNE